MSSLLAIIYFFYRKIHVFTFQNDQFEISTEFLFYPSRLPHVIGSLAWGSESTRDQLFGSSEPCLSTMYDGIHKALDVTTRKSLYQFDALEAGDMLSLDPTGEYCFNYLYSPADRYISSRSNISFIHPRPREQAPTPYI